MRRSAATRVFGTEHPDTLSFRSNAATTYLAAGQLDRALVTLRDVLVERQRILGPSHPDTLAGHSNLAEAYWQADRREEAIALLETASRAALDVLGPQHHVTAWITRSLEMARLALHGAGGDAPGQTA